MRIRERFNPRAPCGARRAVFLLQTKPKRFQPTRPLRGATKDNIVLYYIPVNGADLGEVFDFTTDATGYIGIHEEPDYTNMTASDTVINGMVLFAERIDGVVVGSITPAVGG